MLNNESKPGDAMKLPRRLSASKAPGKRRTQPERTEETKQRLIEAAAEVLRRKGYAGLRVAEVSKLAKVSRGGQIHHFPTKDSLVTATAEYLFRKSFERGTEHARAAMTTDDPIEAIIQDSLEFFFGKDFSVSLDLVLSSGKSRQLRAQVFTHAKQNRLGVEQAWLDVLIAKGLARADAEEVLWLTISIVRGLSIRSLWQEDQPLFRRILDSWKTIAAEHLANRAKQSKSRQRSTP